MKTKYKNHMLYSRILTSSITLLIFVLLNIVTVSAQTTATSTGIDASAEKQKIAVISDIHLGADNRFNETQKNKPALANLLKQIKNSNNVAELVIAGDLMDQWVMPMDYALPVSLSEYNDMIVKNNKEIVDAINAIIKQGNVRVTYVPGNHDMLFNSAEASRIFPGINQARDAEGLGTYRPTSQIAIEHGHRYNIYCAPDPFSNIEFTGGKSILPSGYFYARIGISSFMEGRPKASNIIATLDPKGMDYTQLSYYNYYLFWKNSLTDFTLKESFSDKVIKTGINGYTQTFSVNDLIPYIGTSGKITVNLFNKSVENWAQRQAINNVPAPVDTNDALNNGALATFTDDQAQNQYFKRDANTKVVIFGHSHAAKLMAEKNINGQDVIYANSGTWIDYNGNGPSRTYITIERDMDSSRITVNYKQFNIDGTNTFLDSHQISSK
jgi:UDP-2,3-diacylglucosamine pyrophosphatase LpxH